MEDLGIEGMIILKQIFRKGVKCSLYIELEYSGQW
jgi:hypothetical protein